MPTFHVSGGGSALQDALLSVVYNQTNTFLVEDGVYDPLLFSSSTITANGGNIGSNTLLCISSINGPENCIIDGGTVWENDVFDSTMLSAGKTCLSVDSTIKSVVWDLSCIGFTLRNGYSNSNEIRTGSAVDFYNALNKTFYNCVVEKCYAEVSASSGYGPTINASDSGGSNWHYCKIRNVVGNRRALALNDSFWNCTIENVRTFGNQPILGSGYLYKCIVHDINNGSGAIMEYGNTVANSLFYNITTSPPFKAHRGNVYGNTFICNVGNNLTTDLFTWNTSNKRIVANNIFTTGKIQALSSDPEVFVANNYAGSFSGDEAHLSNNIVGNNPCFVNVAENNFRLESYSPCISAGSAEWLSGYYSQFDLDGKPFKDPNPSIGCYQFSSKKQNMPNRVYPFGNISIITKTSLYDSLISYIEARDGQYIDTNTPVSVDTMIEARWRMAGISIQQRLFGLNDGSPKVFACYINNKTRWAVYTGTSGGGQMQTVVNNTVYNGTFNLGTGVCTINDTTINNGGTPFSSTNTIPIFARKNIGTVIYSDYPAQMRLYWFKIYQGNVLVRDFVPVRIKAEGCLYDKITGEIFHNLGSGQLIAGPDIVT